MHQDKQKRVVPDHCAAVYNSFLALPPVAIKRVLFATFTEDEEDQVRKKFVANGKVRPEEWY